MITAIVLEGSPCAVGGARTRDEGRPFDDADLRGDRSASLKVVWVDW